MANDPKGTENAAAESEAPQGDDSWKTRIQQEKDTLDQEASQRMPEASFLSLIEEFSLRAMVALGQIPNPMSGSAEFDPEAAKYTIDMLGVLEEKTKGNLSPEESTSLEQVVGQLRVAFVHLSKNPPAAGGGSAEGGTAEPDSGSPGPRIIV